MAGGLQFSLKFLLAEILFFAMALALTRALFVDELVLTIFSAELVPPYLAAFIGIALTVATGGCWGAAIGGLFGRMRAGWRVVTYGLLSYLAAQLLFGLVE